MATDDPLVKGCPLPTLASDHCNPVEEVWNGGRSAANAFCGCSKVAAAADVTTLWRMDRRLAASTSFLFCGCWGWKAKSPKGAKSRYKDMAAAAAFLMVSVHYLMIPFFAL